MLSLWIGFRPVEFRIVACGNLVCFKYCRNVLNG